MSLFSFVKEAGEKLIDLLTPGNANAEAQLKKHVESVGLGNPNISATVQGDTIVLKGEVASRKKRKRSSWRRATSMAWHQLTTRSPSQGPWPRRHASSRSRKAIP